MNAPDRLARTLIKPLANRGRPHMTKPSNTPTIRRHSPAPSPTSAHSSFNLQISVSLAFCPQDGRVQLAAEDENGSDHVEKDECDHHRRETRVGGDVTARELGEVRAEGNARRDP